MEDQVIRYRKLHRLVRDFTNRKLVDFDEDSGRMFASLRSAKLRLGSMDLKIASISLAHQATLVTRNVRDFATFQVKVFNPFE